ncbi:hypothetical protein V6N13_028591 [Hibiscus sabdariffa]|uniref:Uncharacterized protein n=1 Tax=Hibiscus sabdariffa TaxID=183260 RepID=A0ABR2P9K4_9ROSI
MVQSRRQQLILLVCQLLTLHLIVSGGHASTLTTATATVFKVKPKSVYTATGHFLGFLPRVRHRNFTVPASSPSRKHNGLGLQSWTTP